MDSHCVLLANAVVVIVGPIYMLLLARQAGSHIQARYDVLVLEPGTSLKCQTYGGRNVYAGSGG